MQVFRLFCFGFVFALLSACASIPLTSLQKLAMLDVETLDISKVEVAIRVQENVEIVDEVAIVVIEATNKKSKESVKEVFMLPKHDVTLTKYLRKQEKEGMRIRRFKFDEGTSSSVHALRAKLIEMAETTQVKNSVSFGVSARPCLTIGTDFIDAMDMTIYLRTNPKKDFYILFKKQEMKFKFDNLEDRDKLYCQSEN